MLKPEAYWINNLKASQSKKPMRRQAIRIKATLALNQERLLLCHSPRWGMAAIIPRGSGVRSQSWKRRHSPWPCQDAIGSRWACPKRAWRGGIRCVR